MVFTLGGHLWGWIMEFKPCHSCEDLAHIRVVYFKVTVP